MAVQALLCILPEEAEPHDSAAAASFQEAVAPPSRRPASPAQNGLHSPRGNAAGGSGLRPDQAHLPQPVPTSALNLARHLLTAANLLQGMPIGVRSQLTSLKIFNAAVPAFSSLATNSCQLQADGSSVGCHPESRHDDRYEQPYKASEQ